MATIGEVKLNVVKAHPGLTEIQWHAVAAGQLEPVALAAGIAVGFWLWMAWAIGRGQRRAMIPFVIFFGLNTYGLLHGLSQSSAVYAPADLAIGSVVWLVELAAVALLFHNEFAWHFRRKIAGSRSETRPISPG